VKPKALHKKIISGRFKGTTIELPPSATTRSSKAIVLESFFNTIQFDIVDATLVEVFSGSGSIGLEALSRGASKVLFMEHDAEALRVLQRNINRTDPVGCELFRGDSFHTITQVIARLQHLNTKAYFYIDPPFSYREGMETVYEKMLALIAALPADQTQMIVVEHMTPLTLDVTIGDYRQYKTKKFGKTSLSYYM